MKNLKKVLSLALAFAMVLGLCIGASAATDLTTLNDWDEVANKDAAQLLGAFDIMKGNADGTFAPDANVTRAQAAAMISRALWGGKDDVALYNGNNIGGYTDTPAGAWYMGYVNYMTAVKVMAGKGEGKFDPEGNVTGYELLKMCLVSLGYNPETEGLVGAGWDINTMALATKPGFQNMTKDVSVTDWNAPLSRTNAAQIIANMVYRNRVSYNLNQGFGGNVTSSVVDSKVSFAEAVLGMKKLTGTLVANPFGKLATDSETNPIDKEARNYADQNAIVEVNVPASKDADGNAVAAHVDAYNVVLESTAADLGNKVTLYVVGNTVVQSNLAAATEVAPKLVDKKADGATDSVWEINNLDENGAKYYINGVEVMNDATATNNVFGTDFAAVVTYQAWAKGYVPNYNADIKYLDTNGDGYIDLVKAYTYTLNDVKADDAKTKDAGDSYKFQVGDSAATTIKKAICDFTAVKGDKVWLTPVIKGSCFNFETSNADKADKTYHGVIAEVGEGKITKSTATTLYIDGVKHSASTDLRAKQGQTGKFYKDLNGAIYAFDAPDAPDATKYGVIFDAGWAEVTKTGALTNSTAWTLRVAAIDEDGKTENYDVASVVKTGADDPIATFEVVGANAPSDAGDITVADITNDADDDGDANVLVKFELNDKGQMKITEVIGVIGTANPLNASDFTGSNSIGTGNTAKYLSAKTIGFLQATAEVKDNKWTEKWTVVKGTSLATTINKDAGSGVKVTADFNDMFGTDDGIAVMAALRGALKADTSDVADLYYALSGEAKVGETNDSKFSVVAFPSKSGKVEELVYKSTNAGLAPGENYTGPVYTTYNAEGTGLGGNPNAALVTKGYIAATADGLVKIDYAKDGTGNNSKTVVVNDKTKIFILDIDNTEPIESTGKAGAIADLSAQSVPDEITTGYQVVVVESKTTDSTDASPVASGTATMIIVIMD